MLLLLLGCEELLVVLGGFGHQQSPIDTVEKFDPKSDTWDTLPVRSPVILIHAFSCNLSRNSLGI